MSKDDTKHALVPRLRFSEFQQMPGWSESALTDICDVNPTHDGLPESFYYIDLESVEAGRLRSPQRIERGNAPNRAQRYLRDGDIVYQTVRPYQRNNLLFDFGGEDDYVASTGYAQLRARESIGFLYQLIHTDSFVERVLAKCTGSNYPAINSSDLESVSVWIPPDSGEQQKIAECLGSLDDLIAAEGRKLEVLRDHKQGLMQRLFPHEGETRPRLRFPEFQNAREWDIQPLSRIAENLDSRRVPITEKDRTPGDIPYYGASGIVDYVNDYLFDEDLLCVSEDGANLVARTYPIAFPISGKTWVNNHAHVLRFEDLATQKMVADYLNCADLQDFITGMAQPKLNRAMLDTIPIPLPESGERKAIAGCFSSLDDLIAAQAEKLDALRTHKRGLMQQLFPSTPPEGAGT